MFEKRHQGVSVTRFVEHTELFIKGCAVLMQHRDRKVAVSHQAAVHHKGCRPPIGVEKELVSSHKEKDANRPFLWILDLCLQEFKALSCHL